MNKINWNRNARRGRRLVLALLLAALISVTGCAGPKKEPAGSPSDAGTGTTLAENHDAGQEAGIQDPGKEDPAAETAGKETLAEPGAAATGSVSGEETGTGEAQAGENGKDQKAGAGDTGAAAKAPAGKETETETGGAGAGKTGAAAQAQTDAAGAGGTEAAGAGKSGEEGKTAGTGSDQTGAEDKNAVTEKIQEDAGSAEGTAGQQETDAYAGLPEFSSSAMGFSFRYEPSNTVKETENGACEMTVAGEKKLTGLFVSCLLAENMPDPKQILAEEAETVSTKYRNAMVEEPKSGNLTVDDHDLTGQTWAYSLPGGGTVECASYIESRRGHYIFFRTEKMRGADEAEAAAMKLAIRTLKIQNDSSSAASGGAGTGSAAKETKKDKKSGDKEKRTVGIAEMTGGGTQEKKTEEEKKEPFESDYIFDVEKKWLVIPEGDATMVCPTGTMQGPSFVVNKIKLEDDKPSVYLSNKAEEIKEHLGERLVTSPEVTTIELGERKLTGIEYEYSSLDGGKTVYQAEYVETTSFGIFDWELTCDQGDNDSVTAMLSAMETFSPR